MASKDGLVAVVDAERLLPGIHGLRGVAALAVVLYHLALIGKVAVPAGFGFIIRDFGLSVHLFFILSAFSLMHSTLGRIERTGWLNDYFIRRFFRIAPLFYCVLTFELLRQIQGGGLSVGFDKIVTNLSFTFGLVPFTEIVWGGWSVGVEMLFYVVFPVIVLCSKSQRSALAWLLISVVVSYSVRSLMHAEHLKGPVTRWDWSYFAFVPNFCFFIMGCFAYRLSRGLGREASKAKTILSLATIALLLALVVGGIGKYFKGAGRLDIIVWGVAFMMLCVWQSVWPSRWLANKYLEYFGERSFSMYLLHPIVMYYMKDSLAKIYAASAVYLGGYAYFFCAIVVLAVLLVLVEITYRLIEIPGINLGKKIIAKKRMVDLEKPGATETA
ncbi:acyltransferase [Pseudomonas fakonensis]|uniref:Acyltransferase n=1 Tax=Pseudomonas fakonensis TaxID=2842355 RepID=A0ABX8N1Q4_9PSED|nr:acyltransferase [Pseudomonas fakonensis]QXH50281.1 acyltransferase [Pseudomonas fakonensis]